MAADRLNLIRVMPAQGGLLSSPKTQTPDLVVIGGGIAGLAVAHRACARGLRPLVLERERPGGATTAVAAGMLAPVSEAAAGEEALLRLNLAAARRYPAWIEELGAAAGRDPGYLRCGTLLVARDRDEAEALERELDLRHQHGLAVERLRPSEARRREPALAPALRLALEVPDDHAVDPAALATALAVAIERGGGEVRAASEVAEVLVREDRVTGVRLAAGETLAAAHVVVAAGPWSGTLPGVPAEARVPVRPVKGQLLRLRDPAGPGLVSHVLRTERCYLVPRGDGRYVLGATVEERGWDTGVTAGAVHDLLRAGAEAVPGVLELEVERALAGLRPGTPDNGPALGPGLVEGLHWATGHYRHGILLAPVTGDAVVSGVLGEPLDEAAPFSARRFQAGVPA